MLLSKLYLPKRSGTFSENFVVFISQSFDWYSIICLRVISEPSNEGRAVSPFMQDFSNQYPQ